VIEPTGDPARRPKAPKTKARLEQLITQWQKDSGQPVARLNLRIAAMMLAGALARVVDREGREVFATKGGIAMELRMGDRARATRDVDLVLRGDPEQLAERLDEGLREPYRGFSFGRGAIGDLPTRPYVKKVRIQVSFAGRVLSSPQLEIAIATSSIYSSWRRWSQTPSTCATLASGSLPPGLSTPGRPPSPSSRAGPTRTPLWQRYLSSRSATSRTRPASCGPTSRGSPLPDPSVRHQPGASGRRLPVELPVRTA
jgi:hypothetical protein